MSCLKNTSCCFKNYVLSSLQSLSLICFNNEEYNEQRFKILRTELYLES